jgi:hypothetical protein
MGQIIRRNQVLTWVCNATADSPVVHVDGRQCRTGGNFRNLENNLPVCSASILVFKVISDHLNYPRLMPWDTEWEMRDAIIIHVSNHRGLSG